MTETMGATCVQAANEVYLAVHDDDEALRACETLVRYGVFSNRNLEAITGLGERTVAAITQKRDKSGGRLNVTTLPMLVRLEADWARGARNDRLARAIVEAGTSRTMIVKLTGIPERAIYGMTQ